MNKLNWKVKLSLSILGIIVLIVVILYGVTYGFFVRQLKKSDERIAQINFAQAEDNLKQVISLAIRDGNSYDMSMMAWNFRQKKYDGDTQKALLMRKITLRFGELLDVNQNLFGMAQINGSGETVLSTAFKNRTGNTVISDDLRQLMLKSQEVYPAYIWAAGEDAVCEAGSALNIMLEEEPVLVGIRSVAGEGPIEEDSFIIMAVSEKQIRLCYEPVVYNGSYAMLLDGKGRIISTNREGSLYRRFSEETGYHIVNRSLAFQKWELVNMIPVENYQREARSIRNFSLAVILSAAVCVFIISLKWSGKYTRPIQGLMDRMEMVGKEQFDIDRPVRTGWPELDNLNMEFYETVQKLKQYINDLKETEQEKAREELKALQYQINPHFLYNSLNSIRWMAMMTNNLKVADSLVMLNKIITPVFRNPSFTWLIRDEIEFLNNYIGMMQLRYGSDLEYHINYEEALSKENFPRFILQPVIENCFVHSGTQNGHMMIRVEIEKTEAVFHIEVANNADMTDEKMLKGLNEKLRDAGFCQEEVGLFNVARRLKFLYGEESSVLLKARERIFICQIEFPASGPAPAGNQ